LDTKLLSADQQAAVEALAAGAGRMNKRVEIASTVAVMLQAREAAHALRTAHMLATSMAVPALARCCLLASRAWSQQPHSCDGKRHDALEVLAFTCHPRDADVVDGAQLIQLVKELVVQELGITAQKDSALWIASKPMMNRGAAAGREAPTHPATLASSQESVSTSCR